MEVPDRISALPEPIIHDILLLLPTKTVKMATSLSKTWYALCSSFPYLDFDDSLFDTHHSIVLFYPEPKDYVYEEEEDRERYVNSISEVKEVREKYVNYVSETLRRFHQRNPITQIKRLRIPITIINSRFASLVDSWIQLALEHGVEELDLNTRCIRYELPKAVFESSSIRVLKLQACSLHLYEPFDHRGVSKTNTKLQELYLRATPMVGVSERYQILVLVPTIGVALISVNLDEDALRSLISYYPLIEYLYIEDTIFIANLRISHLDRLKTLVINSSGLVETMLEKIEVDAPALQTLHVLNTTDHHEYPNENGFCWCPTEIGILDCPILSELKLQYFTVNNFQLEEILSRLPLLRILTLALMPYSSKLTVSSNNLNELVVINCEHLKELEIDAPNLRLFQFVGDVVPQLSPVHTVMGQSQVSLFYRGWESFDRFAVKFRNFISQLKHIRHLDIYLLDKRDLVDEDRKLSVVQPVEPVPHIEELQIGMYKPGGYEDIFDGLLSNCHPHIFTLKSKNYNDYDFLPFIRELMVDFKTARPSSHAKTWRCCLEDIIFEGEGVTHRMSAIGDVPPCFLEGSERFDIKFVFKW